MSELTFRATLGVAFALLLSASAVYAQTPTGIITGTITDSSGAVAPATDITVTNKATGVARTMQSNAEGVYSAPALEPGQYEVKAAKAGFNTVLRDSEVQAGTTTTVNLSMNVGANTEVVTVEAATAQINYESNTIQGVIARQTIQDLPLNGRSYLQLASLEPGHRFGTLSRSIQP